MITINANVDKGKINEVIRCLANYKTAQGLTVQFVCWDVMRAWVLDMIKATAPWSFGRPGNGLAQRDAGRGAAEHDIDTLFARIDDKKNANWERGGKRFVKNKETGAVFVVDQAMWNPPSIRQLHVKNRNSRGRVKWSGRQYWVQKKELSEYVNGVRSRVGSLKAAWLPALYHYARLCNGSTGRIPKWITSQSKRMGGFGGNMDRTGNGTIYAENVAPHVRAIRRDSIEWAARKQYNSLYRFAHKRVQRLCDQFNRGQNPTPTLKAEA